MAAAGVVIFDESPPSDWRRAALSLANACPGLTWADAARACRYSQGFLDLVLAPEQLEAAANALTAAGSPARVISLAERVTVPPAFTLMRIGMDDLGLRCLEPKSPTFSRVPWKRVHLLHLAWVGPSALRPRRDPELDRVDVNALTGLRSMSREPERTVEAEPAELWLEMVLSAPFARLRIRMSSFVYDCLPEPASRSQENLQQVVALLAARAPKAIRTGLIEPCLAGAELDGSSQLDAHENDRAVSWELTRRGSELQAAPPVPESEPPPAPPVDRASALLAQYRRAVLLGLSIPLASGVSFAVLRHYPGLPLRMTWLIWFLSWLPIVGLLSVIYVGVQLRFDTLAERRKL